MKHVPLVPICAAFLIGITVEHYVPLSLIPLWSGGLVFLLGAALLFKRPVIGLVCVYSAVAAAGAITHNYHYRFIAPDHVANRMKGRRLLQLSGEVSSDPRLKLAPVPLLKRRMLENPEERFRTSCEVELEKLHKPDGGEVPLSGRIILKVYEEVPDLSYGDKLRFVAWVQTPNTPTNPGSFDYREYLRRRGIRAAATLPEESAILEQTPGGGGWLFTGLFNARRAAADLMRRHMSPRTSALAEAIVLGRRGRLERSTREAFQRSGTMHLLAVSGLHVGMVALGAWFLLRLVRLPYGMSSLLLVALVLLYAVFTGMRPSALRAAVMVACLCLGASLYRRAILSNLLALAALCIAIFRPGEIFGAGFQLSFAACLGIAGLWRILDAKLSGEISTYDRILAGSSAVVRIRMWLSTWYAKAFGVACAAWVSTAPLLAYHFNISAPVSIVWNLVLVPLGWGGVMLGLLSVGLSGILEWLGTSEWVVGCCLAPLGWWAWLFEWLAQIGAKIPGGFFYLCDVGVGWVVALYAVAVCWLVASALKRRTFPILVAGLVLAAAFVVSRIPEPTPETMRVTCFDMRHGLSVLVRTPRGRTILYDCGTRHPFFDPGAYSVAPALWHRGVRRIDLLVCSHSDIDHISGIPAILERFDVGLAVVPPAMTEAKGDPIIASLFNWFERFDVPVRTVTAGDRIGGFESTEALVLHPLPPPMTNSTSNPNETSVVLALTTGSRTVLLTGDIEEQGIAATVGSEAADADVIVLPHHGRPVGSFEALVEHSSPECAVLSAPEYMKSEAILSRLKEMRVESLPTWEYGCIDVWLDDELIVEGFLKDDERRQE